MSQRLLQLESSYKKYRRPITFNTSGKHAIQITSKQQRLVVSNSFGRAINKLYKPIRCIDSVKIYRIFRLWPLHPTRCVKYLSGFDIASTVSSMKPKNLSNTLSLLYNSSVYISARDTVKYLLTSSEIELYAHQ